MKEVRCADAGMKCDYVARAATEAELLQKVAEHARQKHGIAQITPELAEQVKKLVHEVA